MRVIQIIGSLSAGGAERVVVNNHFMFKKFGAKSKIVVLKNKIFYENIDDLMILNSSKRSKKTYEKLLKIINEFNADLVLLHMQDMGRIFKNYYDKRFFNVIHSDWYERIQKEKLLKKIKIIRDFKKIYDKKNIITVSKGIEKNFLKFNFDINSITTIYNPFDEEKIIILSNEFNVKEKNYILHVASLRDVKRQDVLLKAYKLANLKEDLLIIGDGAKKEDLIKLAKDLGIQNRVKFLGLKQNPYPYIKNAKLLVLSSEAEGFGNVLIESLILKTPVVSTDCNSGPREILTGELKNYLSEVNNPEDLAKKIKSALYNYPIITKKYYEKFLDSNIFENYKKLLLNLEK